MTEGRLKPRGLHDLLIEFELNGKREKRRVRRSQLTQVLYTQDPANLAGVTVQFDLDEHTNPCRICELGRNWEAPSTPVPLLPSGDADMNSQTSHRKHAANESSSCQQGDFHNPYNFVPALPREDILGELADSKPRGHDRYHEDCWTGRIRVRLETISPLLLPDAARANESAEGHRSFPIRMGPDGKPYLAPTSVKGMLRSAYECVTNSRLSVFTGHKERLAFRREARLSLVPARVERDERDMLVFRIMKSQFSSIGV